MHIWKATKCPRTSLFRSSMCHSAVTVGELVGVHRTNWGWRQGWWPQISAESLLHVLKNAESDAELKDSDVDYLAYWAQPGVQNPEIRHRTYRAQGWINPSMSSPRHTEMTLSEKEQTVPKPEEEVAQKKKISQKNLKKQKLKVSE